MIRALGAAFPVSARSLHIAVGLGAIAFLVLLVRSAWISDDAAISLRTVLNVTHGFGLTFNIAERVQTFTHPLWLLLLVAAYLVIGNLFVATIALSVVVSVAAFWLLLVRAATPLQAGFAAVALVFSRAFVDFSVSGLENPLLNLLLAVFLLAYLAPLSDRGRWLVRLWILASLVYLTRPDGVLFVAPLLLVACVKVRSAGAIARAVAIGVIPAVAWTVFSLIYYGFPFPNTAYAKLATGINGGELRQQGFVYLVDSLDRDPLTITAIGFALVFTLLTRTLTAIAWVAGIVLYLVHVVWIGGDFMAGRFLAAPFFASVLLMSWLAISRREVLLPAIGLAVLVGATAPEPPLWRVAAATNPDIRPNGIVDERAIYFMHRSLVRSTRQRLRDPSWPIDTGARPSLRVAETCGLMGQGGLDLGPYVHLLDVCALADPLLARLPAVYNDDWRPGHYRRMVPGGYVQSLEGSSNLLTDPGLRAYYDQLRLVTRSRPLFSRDRLTAIVSMNMGRYDNQIDRTFYRHEGSVTRLRAIGQVKETGEPSTGEGVRSLDTPLAVLCDEISGRRQIDISLDSDDRYELIFLNGTRRIDQVEISSVPQHRRAAGLMRHTIDVPPRALQRGFDTIVITAVAGDDPPAIGHLLVK